MSGTQLYDWEARGDFADVPRVPGDSAGVPAQVNPLAVRACLVALASGKTPSIRALKAAVGIGQARAQALQGWLRYLAGKR